MKQRLHNILMAPLGWMLHLLALMPWWVLHAHASVLYFLIYHVVGYRRKVVRQNLLECFPGKSEKERRNIEKEFFRHFADMFFETIKLLHISPDDMRKRIEFVNAEYLDRAFENNQSVMLYISHLGNWEWITSLSLWLSPETMAAGHLLGSSYLPLHNKWVDDFMMKIRSHFGFTLISGHHVLRTMLMTRKAGKQIGIGFISDQHPLPNDQDHVVRFLNHPTAIITVTETIARKLDMRVVYMHMSKVGRSRYVCRVVPLTDHAATTEPGQLTDTYARLLEDNIHEQPAYWLWTHKRWKRRVEYPEGFVDRLHPGDDRPSPSNNKNLSSTSFK